MQDYLLDIYLELKKNYKIIKTTYNLLSVVSDLKIPTHSAGQWLLDNMYIIEQEYKVALDVLSNRLTLNLPNVTPTNGKQQLRAFFMANEMLEKNAGIVDDGVFSNYIKKFQKQTYLTYEELIIMPIMLRVATIKFMQRICLNIFSAEIQKIKVEEDINKNLELKENKKILKNLKYLNKLKNNLIKNSGVKVSNTSYIEHMAFRLKDLGSSADKYLETLKEETNKVGYTIDEAIEKEHSEIAKTTSLISNAIRTMKNIALTNWEEVLVNINRIDETLIEDYSGEYKRCDFKTKGRYRNEVISLAKKYKVSEMYIAKKAVECSKKYQKHIGHFLIGRDKQLFLKSINKNSFIEKLKQNIINPIKPKLYIISILSVGFLTSFITHFIILNNLADINILQKILIYIISFFFGLEIGDKVITYVISKFIRPKFLPRFNFSKTIDETNSTLVAMPTLINSIEKIDKLIKKLEVTYLSNRSNNMYYLLLGDCMSAKTSHIDLDDEIIKYGNKKIEELNNKYPASPKLFNFLYRKRVYSDSESCYMGWERKRGALTELNALLLNKLSQEEIDAKMYLTHLELPEVKYVITVDEDTQLSLNAAKELVAIISHPLNKPVLSKNKKIVKYGYGLIQPSIGLDIQAANGSIFSKVFGGFGGLDIYTNAISNLYQDVFGEAIFTGKGIYNIEIFNELIGTQMPENLILSHDLLEGSFLRTGLASDVEVQDGFPSNFIAYNKRNHRWFRGDMQISRWIFNFKSGLNLLSRWKIFDNIRRETLDIYCFLLWIIALHISAYAFMCATIAVFVIQNIGYLFSVFDQIIFGKKFERKQKQYIPVIFGIRATLLKMVFNVITIPYKVFIVISAHLTSLYRMYISKKKLLEWTTAEKTELSAKEKYSYVFLNMWPNILFAIIITILALFDLKIKSYEIFIILMAGFIYIATIAAYIMSKQSIFPNCNNLSSVEKKEILEIGKDTWNFFNDNMNELNNFLPPDNLQENRRPKIASRTSPTNIGMGILAIVNAYDLKYISLEDCLIKLNHSFESIKKLQKWNGHLYNWYNIRNLKVLYPLFVSTVDSGNFIASIKVCKSFLISLKNSLLLDNELLPIVDDILKYIGEYLNTVDYEKLYSKGKNLFSVGFDVEKNKLENSYYDMLMSESRTISMLAIASGKITSKHWFSLARNLIKINNKKGLISWSGTSFEYFMPNIFMKSFEYTLIDESLNFSLYSQLKYGRKNKKPWGISEAGYALQDLDQSYQYKAFGVPWLGLKRGLNESMVVAPYASILCLNSNPRLVYENIHHLKQYGAYSNYGFFESIDFTKKHMKENNKYENVMSYMSHHQGMILSSINNYINNEIIQERFHKNPEIEACEILLKERMPLSVVIHENIHSKYNKFEETDVSKYSSYINYIDKQRFLDEKIPFINIHTNGKLGTTLLSTGQNYMYYKDIAITKNRYISNKTNGNIITLTDKTTGKIWSASFEPNYLLPDDYFVSASLGNTEYYRKDGALETRMLVSISPQYNIEIRRVTLKNNSNIRREIIINTELELALTNQAASVIHPAFNNLLIEEYFDKDLEALIAKRRTKTEEEINVHAFAKLIGIDLEIEIETEKSKLLENSGRDAYDPNISKYPLWPIISYRARIILDPEEEQTFYYITGVSENKYNISNIIVNADIKSLENEIELSMQKENINAKYLKLEKGKANLYNNILADVIFGKSKLSAKTNDISWNNNFSQSMLWKFGISGDFKIITASIGKIEDLSLIQELIKFMDYIKSRKFNLDIVILVDEELYTGEPIKTQLVKMLERVVYISHTPGKIYVLNIKNMNETERQLFKYISCKDILNIEEFIPKIENIYFEDEEE